MQVLNLLEIIYYLSKFRIGTDLFQKGLSQTFWVFFVIVVGSREQWGGFTISPNGLMYHIRLARTTLLLDADRISPSKLFRAGGFQLNRYANIRLFAG